MWLRRRLRIHYSSLVVIGKKSQRAEKAQLSARTLRAAEALCNPASLTLTHRNDQSWCLAGDVSPLQGRRIHAGSKTKAPAHQRTHKGGYRAAGTKGITVHGDAVWGRLRWFPYIRTHIPHLSRTKDVQYRWRWGKGADLWKWLCSASPGKQGGSNGYVFGGEKQKGAGGRESSKNQSGVCSPPSNTHSVNRMLRYI